jgi:adenine-specific DNA-methyltransferase
VDSARYVGARIGIHNPRGERVGHVSHVRNTELIFVAGPDARAIAREGTRSWKRGDGLASPLAASA